MTGWEWGQFYQFMSISSANFISYSFCDLIVVIATAFCQLLLLFRSMDGALHMNFYYDCLRSQKIFQCQFYVYVVFAPEKIYSVVFLGPQMWRMRAAATVRIKEVENSANWLTHSMHANKSCFFLLLLSIHRVRPRTLVEPKTSKHKVVFRNTCAENFFRRYKHTAAHCNTDDVLNVLIFVRAAENVPHLSEMCGDDDDVGSTIIDSWLVHLAMWFGFQVGGEHAATRLFYTFYTTMVTRFIHVMCYGVVDFEWVNWMGEREHERRTHTVFGEAHRHQGKRVQIEIVSEGGASSSWNSTMCRADFHVMSMK